MSTSDWRVYYTAQENQSPQMLRAMNEHHARELAVRMSLLHKAATVYKEDLAMLTYIAGEIWQPPA